MLFPYKNQLENLGKAMSINRSLRAEIFREGSEFQKLTQEGFLIQES